MRLAVISAWINTTYGFAVDAINGKKYFIHFSRIFGPRPKNPVGEVIVAADIGDKPKKGNALPAGAVFFPSCFETWGKWKPSVWETLSRLARAEGNLPRIARGKKAQEGMWRWWLSEGEFLTVPKDIQDAVDILSVLFSQEELEAAIRQASQILEQAREVWEEVETAPAPAPSPAPDFHERMRQKIREEIGREMLDAEHAEKKPVVGTPEWDAATLAKMVLPGVISNGCHGEGLVEVDCGHTTAGRYWSVTFDANSFEGYDLSRAEIGADCVVEGLEQTGAHEYRAIRVRFPQPTPAAPAIAPEGATEGPEAEPPVEPTEVKKARKPKKKAAAPATPAPTLADLAEALTLPEQDFRKGMIEANARLRRAQERSKARAAKEA